jgi:hypothetical protein
LVNLSRRIQPTAADESPWAASAEGVDKEANRTRASYERARVDAADTREAESMRCAGSSGRRNVRSAAGRSHRAGGRS